MLRSSSLNIETCYGLIAKSLDMRGSNSKETAYVFGSSRVFKWFEDFYACTNAELRKILEPTTTLKPTVIVVFAVFSGVA